MATISFYGGVGSVTGSKYLLEHNGKRVLAELIKAACKHCAEQGRTHFYGFVISRLRQELQSLRVPCEVLSSAVAPMGEDSFLVRFSVDELIRY